MMLILMLFLPLTETMFFRVGTLRHDMTHRASDIDADLQCVD